MRYSGKTLMAFSLMAMATWMFITALKWPLRAAIFIFVVSIPVFFLAMFEAYLSLRKEKGDREARGADFKFSEDVDPAVAKRRISSIFLWMLGFFFLIVLVGFQISVPLLLFLYLKLQGKERWGISLGLAFLSWGLFYGLFVWLLQTPFQEGLLQKALRTFRIG